MKDLAADNYSDVRPGLASRCFEKLFSPKGKVIAAGIMAIMMVGGTAFLGLGGYSYMKKVYWKMTRQSRIVVPDAEPQALKKPDKPAKPAVKRPPDWGPTLFAPESNARAQGGSHG